MKWKTPADFYRDIQGKKITVVGIGVSNTPLIERLCACGALVTACDKREAQQMGETYDKLTALGVKLCLGETYMDDLSGDMIFKTPGMRFDHPALLAAAQRGSVITSEMEIFFELCPCQIIAVTGSDGKTTTTTLISQMLKEAGYKVHLGGNIGKPLLPEIDTIQETDIAVLELSSFQLHTMRRSPHIAVVTNLAPNHLDVHKDMQEYIDAKENIFRYQTKDDILVLNFDNDITRSFAERSASSKRWFSFADQGDVGVYRKDGRVYTDIDGKECLLLSREDILLRGDHNVENYMAAIAAVWGMVSPEVIQKVARTFGGVKHRIEFVREVGGVRFYNDSIGSSPSRTVATLKSFEQKVHLIAGGYDKKIPFDALAEVAETHVKAIYLNGATAPAIRAALKGMDIPVFEGTFAQCVRAAYQNAQKGDEVVLSPACASFDQFKNFEERGETFIRLVGEL